MKIQQQRHGAVTILRPDGPLVAAEAEQLAASMTQAMQGNLGRVVLDLRAVPFVDSKGLETLLDLTEAASLGGRALKLCGVNKTIRQVLELTGLVSSFEHFVDTTAAVRSFL